MSRNLHHANLLVGTPEEAESYLRSLCHSLDIEFSNNPDLFVFKMDTFGIDEARELKLLSARKAVTPRKIFLVAPRRLTLEAQNALLKTFEDPFPDTYFFLAMREESLVIPTLLSRMQIIRTCGGVASAGAETEKFLSFSIKDRLLFARSFAMEEKNLSVFLDSLLFLLRREQGKEGLLEKVYNVRCFAQNSTAAASRLVIEHLSLVL